MFTILDRLQPGADYRLKDGSTITFYKVDGSCVLTDRGPIYISPFLRDMLDLPDDPDVELIECEHCGLIFLSTEDHRCDG